MWNSNKKSSWSKYIHLNRMRVCAWMGAARKKVGRKQRYSHWYKTYCNSNEEHRKRVIGTKQHHDFILIICARYVLIACGRAHAQWICQMDVCECIIVVATRKELQKWLLSAREIDEEGRKDNCTYFCYHFFSQKSEFMSKLTSGVGYKIHIHSTRTTERVFGLFGANDFYIDATLIDAKVIYSNYALKIQVGNPSFDQSSLNVDVCQPPTNTNVHVKTACHFLVCVIFIVGPIRYKTRTLMRAC